MQDLPRYGEDDTVLASMCYPYYSINMYFGPPFVAYRENHMIVAPVAENILAEEHVLELLQHRLLSVQDALNALHRIVMTMTSGRRARYIYQGGHFPPEDECQ